MEETGLGFVQLAVRSRTTTAKRPSEKRSPGITGTVQFKLDGRNIGSPVVVAGGLASTAPLAMLAGALIIAGVLIQRKANRSIEEKLPPEKYRA